MINMKQPETTKTRPKPTQFQTGYPRKLFRKNKDHSEATQTLSPKIKSLVKRSMPFSSC